MLVLGVALAAALPASAGADGTDGYIAGHVYDAATNGALVGATVTFVQDASSYTATTGSDGSYTSPPLSGCMVSNVRRVRPHEDTCHWDVEFAAPGHVTQWWEDAPSQAQATGVPVASNETYSGVDATLSLGSGGGGGGSTSTTDSSSSDSTSTTTTTSTTSSTTDGTTSPTTSTATTSTTTRSSSAASTSSDGRLPTTTRAACSGSVNVFGGIWWYCSAQVSSPLDYTMAQYPNHGFSSLDKVFFYGELGQLGTMTCNTGYSQQACCVTSYYAFVGQPTTPASCGLPLFQQTFPLIDAYFPGDVVHAPSLAIGASYAGTTADTGTLNMSGSNVGGSGAVASGALLQYLDFTLPQSLGVEGNTFNGLAGELHAAAATGSAASAPRQLSLSGLTELINRLAAASPVKAAAEMSSRLAEQITASMSAIAAREAAIAHGSTKRAVAARKALSTLNRLSALLQQLTARVMKGHGGSLVSLGTEHGKLAAGRSIARVPLALGTLHRALRRQRRLTALALSLTTAPAPGLSHGLPTLVARTFTVKR